MFKEDLEKGREVEQELARELIDGNVHSVEFAPNRKFKDWDIKVVLEEGGTEKEKTYEVKYDMVSENSGNVGFEYYCNGEPSGVYASKADYIVYKLGNDFYCVNRGLLLVWLNHISKKSVKGGDNKLSYMYLVKKELFIEFSKKHNEKRR